jgi:hypothetical protein
MPFPAQVLCSAQARIDSSPDTGPITLATIWAGSEIMSFKIVEQAPARLNRSELAVPGSQPQLFEKAAKSAADVIFLDLEDAVAPDDKAPSRCRSASTASTPISCTATWST